VRAFGVWVLGLFLVACGPDVAWAQERSFADVLGFLLTNRAVRTDDFERDAAAAEATRDTVTRLLTAELATLPPSLSSIGFVYRYSPELGTMERASDSFGSFFTERSLTAGRGQSAFGVNLRLAGYQRLDGRDLDDGTFLTTANQFRDEPLPFDDETLTLDLSSRVLTFTGTFGVTDRLDVSAAVPVVSLSMTGSRVNTYRGERIEQARASATTSGLGDVALRAKYGVVTGRAGGVAVAGELRLPTGREEDLLGAGSAAFSAMVIASAERGVLGWHGNVSLSGGGLASELAYRGAVCFAASGRVTVVGEVLGRRVADTGRISTMRAPHPTIANVDTIRLVTDDTSVTTGALVAGAKWNLSSTWILNGHVLLPVSERGLRSGVVTLVGIDYAFGQ
jgi:hypothetical protein